MIGPETIGAAESATDDRLKPSSLAERGRSTSSGEAEKQTSSTALADSRAAHAEEAEPTPSRKPVTSTPDTIEATAWPGGAGADSALAALDAGRFVTSLPGAGTSRPPAGAPADTPPTQGAASTPTEQREPPTVEGSKPATSDAGTTAHADQAEAGGAGQPAVGEADQAKAPAEHTTAEQTGTEHTTTGQTGTGQTGTGQTGTGQTAAGQTPAEQPAAAAESVESPPAAHPQPGPAKAAGTATETVKPTVEQGERTEEAAQTAEEKAPPGPPAGGEMSAGREPTAGEMSAGREPTAGTRQPGGSAAGEGQSPAEPAAGEESSPGEPAELFPGAAPSLPDGSAPSPEYRVKAHLAGKRYYTDASPYFARTAAQVWFRTEEDAERAGFTSAG